MSGAIDPATIIFNLPGYRVLDAVPLSFGQRRITVDPPGCPACGVIASRRKDRLQRVREIPVGGPGELVWAKQR